MPEQVARICSPNMQEIDTSTPEEKPNRTQNPISTLSEMNTRPIFVHFPDEGHLVVYSGG